MNADRSGSFDASASVLGRGLLLGAWLGIVAGLVELPLLALRRFGLGIPIYMTPQVTWGAPLSYVLLFVPAALLLAALARRWQVFGHPAAAVLPLTLLGCYSVLQVYRIELHVAAILLLTAGIAWQATAATVRRPDALLRLARRSMAPLILLVAALAAGINLLPILAERRALASLTPARAGAPNVILLILDTMRAANMTLYGHERPTTPNLDRLADDGAVFERAVATSSWSNPSHGGIFTGHFPHNVSTGWQTGLDDTHPTIAERLRDAGYRTAGFSANTRYVSRQTGMGRGFARFDDFPVFALDAALATTWVGRQFTDRGNFLPRLLGILTTPGRKSAPDVLDPLLAWMDNGDDRPFFAFANLMDVHGIRLPPDPWASRFGAVPPPSRPAYVAGRVRRLFGGEPAPAPLYREVGAYDAVIARLDERLGAFFDALDARGLRDSTIVILTSDHGEEFHEHGLFGHGVSLYWPAIHVPLIVWLPGNEGAGVRVRTPVSLRSIPVTIAGLVGVVDSPFPGRSLARAWDGTGIEGDTVLSELPRPQPVPVRGRDPLPEGPIISIVVDSLHYIRYADGSEEVFDIVLDPWEQENLIGGVGEAELETLRAMLDWVPTHVGPPSARVEGAPCEGARARCGVPWTVATRDQRVENRTAPLPRGIDPRAAAAR